MGLILSSYPEKYYYFWAMKINRGIYYILVLAGAFLLFTASFFAFREVGLALGFSLLMAGLYGLSRQRNSTEGDSPSTEEDD